MWVIALKFITELLTGDIFRLWAAHKVQEANNADNKVLSLSDAAVAEQLRKWTKPN